MRFGMHLRELSRLRIGIAASVVVAAVAAAFSVVSLPSFKPRTLTTATAYTQVMVDTPQSSLLDLGVNSDVLQTMTTRALLVGNLMSTPPVAAYISREVGVPTSLLQIQAPSAPVSPQPRTVPGRSNGPSDLFRSPHQYRLMIFADPIVPFLNVYAQAPTAKAAAELANGAVDGLGTYLHSVASAQRLGPGAQVRLRQFGRAQGKVLNPGINTQVALLTFLVVFAAGCLVTFALGRIRRGWRVAAAAAQA